MSIRFQPWVVLLLWSPFVTAQFLSLQAEELAPLPIAVTNNAVTSVIADQGTFIISFAGLTADKAHHSTISSTFVLDVAKNQWATATPLPGGVGRLAAVATTLGSLAYVFGGFSVAEDGTEVSTPWVHSFDPVSGTFRQLQPMPVPVDDAVALPFQGRYIYLISGWHDLGNVNLVQRFDVRENTWSQATPIPGNAVFGHAGGIVGRHMLFCDGVRIQSHERRRRSFAANAQCFLGLIDASDSRRIDWRVVPAHPGPPRYRMAAAGDARRNTIAFIGGSHNPYNYSGVGYDGVPSEPAGGALIFDLEHQEWQLIHHQTAPTMDHRGLLVLPDSWVTVGGMIAGQQVTKRVARYRLRQ